MSAAELVLSSDALAQVLAHCAELSPREAVGLLGGRSGGGAVAVALPLVNIASSDRVFIADPYSQYRAFHQLESDGHDLLGIYHSHPGGGLEPSPDDVAYARKWPCAQVIVATSERENDVRLGAFRCVAAGIEVVPIRVAHGRVGSTES